MVQVIQLESSSNEYTTYDVTLPVILFGGQPHTLRIDYHSLYQIISIYVDDFSSPIFVVDRFESLTALQVMDRVVFLSEATVGLLNPLDS